MYKQIHRYQTEIKWREFIEFKINSEEMILQKKTKCNVIVTSHDPKECGVVNFTYLGLPDAREFNFRFEMLWLWLFITTMSSCDNSTLVGVLDSAINDSHHLDWSVNKIGGKPVSVYAPTDDKMCNFYNCIICFCLARLGKFCDLWWIRC